MDPAYNCVSQQMSPMDDDATNSSLVINEDEYFLFDDDDNEMSSSSLEEEDHSLSSSPSLDDTTEHQVASSSCEEEDDDAMSALSFITPNNAFASIFDDYMATSSMMMTTTTDEKSVATPATPAITKSNNNNNNNNVKPLPIVHVQLPSQPPQQISVQQIVVENNSPRTMLQTSSHQQQQQQQPQQQPELSAYLKPAKGREDQYIAGDFPVSLLCNPYKYDLKLVGEIVKDIKTPTSSVTSITDLLNQQRKMNQEESEFLALTLVDADTLSVPVISVADTAAGVVPPSLKKEFVTVESISKVHNRERIIRFAFNLCSFHVKRRSFRLVVLNKNNGEHIFVSSPFKTFARRRDSQTSQNNRSSFQRTLCSNAVYFMQQKQLQQQQENNASTIPAGKVQKKARKSSVSSTAHPYAVPTKSTATSAAQVISSPRSSPTTVVTKQEQQQPQQQQQQQTSPESPVIVYATSPIPTMYTAVPAPMMNVYAAGYQQGCFTYPIESLLHNLGPQERTSLAIQLMSSLSPIERQTVDFYLSCSNQCHVPCHYNVVPPTPSKHAQV